MGFSFTFFLVFILIVCVTNLQCSIAVKILLKHSVQLSLGQETWFSLPTTTVLIIVKVMVSKNKYMVSAKGGWSDGAAVQSTSRTQGLLGDTWSCCSAGLWQVFG